MDSDAEIEELAMPHELRPIPTSVHRVVTPKPGTRQQQNSAYRSITPDPVAKNKYLFTATGIRNHFGDQNALDAYHGIGRFAPL